MSMRKILLSLCALLMTSMQMFADGFKAQPVENAPFMGVSENGKYGIFSIDGIILCIVDLNNPGDMENPNMFYDDRGYDAFQNEYLPGYGTSVANDGTAVGNAVLYELTSETTYSSTDNAVVYSNGEIKVLPSPRPDLYNMAHAITPDGSVICGNVGNAAFSMDTQNIMMVPAVWYRNAEGGYDEPIMLPHPEKDFLGGIPQYVTAIAISADGNTVAGTVTATSGFWIYPIVYKRDVATGEWSYTLPCLDLFYTHPEVTVPADPGDYPEMRDFMTAQEIAAYNLALRNWQEAGGNDWSTYPSLDDFMTDEEKDAYQTACIEFEAASEAYQNAVDQATAGSVTMTFNNVVLSPDGKQLASTYTPDSGWGPMMMSKNRKAPQLSPKYSRILNAIKKNKANKATRAGEETEDYTTATTFVFNLEDDTYKTYTCADGINVICAANNGIFTGYASDVYTPEAVVIDPNKGVVKMQDYYKESCPEMTAWINENMAHEVEGYDPETFEPVMENKTISGIPFCTPDMKTMTTYTFNSFDFATDAYYFGYIFQGLPEAGNGGTSINTAVKDVDRTAEYFTVDGRKVSAPVKGLNIIKTANGEVKKVIVK